MNTGLKVEALPFKTRQEKLFYDRSKLRYGHLKIGLKFR